MIFKNVKIRLATISPGLVGFRKKAHLQLKRGESYSLLYHSFTESDQSFCYNIVPYEKFYDDIITLRQHFEFTNKWESDGSRQCYITFDDGFKSILPVLNFCEKNQIKTTLFINGYTFRNRRLLPKDMIRQVCRTVEPGTELEFLGLRVKARKLDISRDYIAMTFNRRALSILSPSEYTLEIESFYNRHKKADILPELQLLSREDINFIAKNYKNCLLGYHGQEHYSLRNLVEGELVKREMIAPQEDFFELSGQKAIIYSYAYGHYNKYSLSIARDLGYKFAITTNLSPIGSSRQQSPHSIPRFPVDNLKLEVI